MINRYMVRLSKDVHFGVVEELEAIAFGINLLQMIPTLEVD